MSKAVLVEMGGALAAVLTFLGFAEMPSGV